MVRIILGSILILMATTLLAFGAPVNIARQGDSSHNLEALSSYYEEQQLLSRSPAKTLSQVSGPSKPQAKPAKQQPPRQQKQNTPPPTKPGIVNRFIGGAKKLLKKVFSRDIQNNSAHQFLVPTDGDEPKSNSAGSKKAERGGLL